MSMSGHRNKGHLNSKSGREIFLTSSSLSFSSLSSSGASWDDAVERHTKESTTSCEEPKEELSKASSQGSEMQSTTNVSTQPGPSPPLRLRPVQLRNNGYDPNRIPASVFGKNKEVNWSEVSNDSLFSLKMDGYRMSNSQGYRQSNLKPEEALKSGEFLAYSPYISIKLEEAEEKISEVEETKSEETGGVTSVETRKHHQEKPSSLAPPIILWTATPSDYCSWEARPKKRKKTKKSKKKKEKKKKKNKCCIWSWLCSRFSKCEVNLCCEYKWRKCCCFKGTK